MEAACYNPPPPVVESPSVLQGPPYLEGPPEEIFR